MSVCPKCGYRLKITDIKAECPQCGVNLMYFDMEQRLERDAVNAAEEEKKVQAFREGVKSSSIGSILTIARLVVYVLFTGALLLPVFQNAQGGFGLLQMISEMTAKDADIMAVLFGSQTAVLSTVYFFGTVLIALVSLILSFFSFTKHGTGRNMVTAAIAALAQVVPAALLASGGTMSFGAGFYVEAVLVVVLFVMHFVIGKKLKQ